MDSDWLQCTVRLVGAAVLGGVIGVNRELHQKPAGIRTHALVSLGAASIMLVTLTMSEGSDPNAASRAIQGIVTGVGFLGTGVILHPFGQASVRGLTTAATIWIAAALGIASGAGHWPVAVVATILSIIVLTAGVFVEAAVHRLVGRFGPGRSGDAAAHGANDRGEPGKG